MGEMDSSPCSEANTLMSLGANLFYLQKSSSKTSNLDKSRKLLPAYFGAYVVFEQQDVRNLNHVNTAARIVLLISHYCILERMSD